MSNHKKSTETKIVAGIPCYNEESHIANVVSKAREYVDQVLVVDDGSNDRTAELAQSAGAIVIKHKVNRGKGMAMNTAFEWAREIKAGAVVLLDGDGQHNPAEIPVVLEPVLKGEADVVVGSRFLAKKSSIPRYRVLGQHVLTYITGLGSGLKLTDCQSGFRSFSANAVEALKFTKGNVGDVECEMQFLIKQNKLKVTEVPIIVSYENKAKRNPVRQGVGNLFAVFHLVIRGFLRRKTKG